MSTVVGASFAFPYKDFEARAADAARDVFFDGDGFDPAARRFLEQIHEDAIAEDVEELSVDDMVFSAARFWTWAQERVRGVTKLRLEPGKRADGSPMARDVLEIIADDKPFLVDSVMGEINEQGVDVLAMFHPIVTLDRDEKGRRSDSGAALCESMIQVHVEALDEDARARLLAGVRATLADVDAAVTDFGGMRARMDQAIDELKTAPTGAPREEMEESIAFLRWLRDDNFAFLGCRVYEFAADADGALLQEEPIILDETGRGVLRDPMRHVLRRGSEPAIITPAIHEFLCEPSPLIVAKANLRSRVHRRVYMDYIGVKRYRPNGEVVGETRFVGLFTASAYIQAATEVPLVRRKVRRTLERADRTPESHSFKQLKNILETYPRDELFQSEEDELLEISLGVLHLFDRPRPKLFIRRDRFDRFASAFAFIPRERYDSELRVKIGDLLVDAFKGRLSAFYPAFSDGPLARVHFIIGLDPFNHPEPKIADLEAAIADMARTWEDHFERAARRGAPPSLRPKLQRYQSAFSAGYREANTAEDALADAEMIEALDPSSGFGVRAYRRDGDAEDVVRLKLYHRDRPIALSDIMPTLEAAGLRVRSEHADPVRRAERADDAERDMLPVVYVHDFEMRAEDGPVDLESVATPFEEAIYATWTGRNESDGFNRLIVSAGLTWREVCLMRACARYRQQSGLDPSQAVQEEALASNPDIVRMLLDLAAVKFDPAVKGEMAARTKKANTIRGRIAAALEQVASLDHDRVLRRIDTLIAAVQRTNFYQTGPDGSPKAAIALKIASREIAELPAPKPYREIFVWSPEVEGVHIRFGAVARGGLRWSDRRDDFRTEVLGLVKAQVVKNAVIVPVGAKGGFFAKQLPRGGAREEIQAAGVAAYKTFIRSLLDVTDNLVDDAIVKPKDVVCWDDDDPYLVVAADKGTATFSDIANGISLEYGHWLGDAFASGGSAGYDHKKMGITARGAWVAVQRHFREKGKDIQAEPFTVAGVGDMSGDVFGNGMLLSKQIRLVAAFDHRDIFLDPNPGDAEANWAERDRLFKLGRSSWRDYDTSLISKGGGVFSRADKAISLSPEVKAALDIDADRLTPNELISAILRSPVELVWFGGIGTYIRADDESDLDVGDRANDAVRIGASDVRAAVIGEGANLGVTQDGRIALSRRGVALNADFIDNSGGVDSSDHEVNIKILLNPIVGAGRMALEDRNQLLEDMTDEVADKVLQHNYDQTLALTLAVQAAASDRDAHERLIERLEARVGLDRVVERLPSAEEFRELREAGHGLSRPEIATIMSHAKIALFDRILESTVPDDPHFDAMLTSYFPAPLREFGDEIKAHRLKREIIATKLANDLVDFGGPTFAHRARESTGGDTDAVARGFEAARRVFGFHTLARKVNALDNVAPSAVQLQLYNEIILILRRQTYWLVRRSRGVTRTLNETIAAYKPGVDALRAIASEIISPFETQRVGRRAQSFIDNGAPEDLAREIAGVRPLTSSSDVIDLANRRAWSTPATARVYHKVGDRLLFDRLRAAGGDLASPQHWDRLALRRLIEDLYAEQLRFTEAALDGAGGAKDDVDDAFAVDAVEAWVGDHKADVARVDEAFEEMATSGGWTMAKIAIAAGTLRELGSDH